MRRFVEGYRWMWGAIRRWKGGPLWRRTPLFLLYVLRDVFGTGRRTALAAGAVAALFLGTLLSLDTVLEKPEAPVDVGAHREAESLEVATRGMVRLRGQWMALSDLGPALDRYGVRYADVAIEGDATVRVVMGVQDVMVDHGVEVARVRMTGSF